MKRKNNLYEGILDYDNILKVANEVLKTNRNKEISLEFSKGINCRLIDIKNKLLNNNYSFSKYKVFMIKDPKHRIIMSEIMEDKIVNHLVSKYILLPSIEKCNIDTNVATRVGKGSSYGFDLFCKYIKKIGLDKKIYVLKIDISKYFYNIDHELLYEKLKRKIKDPKALKILLEILNTTNYEYINKQIKYIVDCEINKIKKLSISNKEKNNMIANLKSIPLYCKGKGLPIGNMTSQLLAVFYLNDVDRYIKEELKFKYYIRYMDDLVILSTSKEKLIASFKNIYKKIEEHRLVVNQKSNIYKLNVGVSFLGYTFKVDNNTLWIRYNTKTIRKIDRKLRKSKITNYDLYYKSKNSYKGYFSKCNTPLYYKKLKSMEINNMYEKYLELKKDFKEYVVFIKCGKFYRTYDEDAIIMNYLLCYQIMDNRLGFPLEGLFKVKNKLKSECINYVIADGVDIFSDVIDDNKYNEVLSLGRT